MAILSSEEQRGVMKAIVWLGAMGRPILADKMERELLHEDLYYPFVDVWPLPKTQ